MSRLAAGQDLSLLLVERLLVRVLSFLDVFDLFVARMVCARWQALGSHPDLYTNVQMQDIMMYNRYLPFYVLNNFVDGLSLSSSEIEAMKECCRAMPSIPLPGDIVDLESPVSHSLFNKIKSPKENNKNKEKEQQRLEKLRMEKEKRHAELKAIWNEEIIPNWDKAIKNTKRIRELVFQGIPPSVRVKVWPLLVGNELRITPELFEIFLQRAARAKMITVQNGEGAALGREGTVALVHLDLPRTFPALSIFQTGGPCHGQLASVLEAYVCYRPDVGYVQGMSYIAAVLLLNMDEYHAFTCFANVLNNPCYMSFYSMNLDEMKKYMGVLEYGLSVFVPKVGRHLKEHGISPEVYIMDWVLTIFAKALPLDLSARVWDMVFLEGEIFVFQAALGVMKYFTTVLESESFDECMSLLTHLPGTIEDEELFKCIEACRLTEDMFRKFGCRL